MPEQTEVEVDQLIFVKPKRQKLEEKLSLMEREQKIKKSNMHYKNLFWLISKSGDRINAIAINKIKSSAYNEDSKKRGKSHNT